MIIRLVSAIFFWVTMGCTLSAQPTFPYEQFDTDLPPAAVYAQRRAALLQQLPANSAMVVLSADVRNRWNDVDYEYRQNSNMLYLCGYPSASSQLIIAPRGINLGDKIFNSILLVPKRNPIREQWLGVEMGTSEAQKYLGIDTVLENTEFSRVLKDLVKELDTLFVAGWPTKAVPLPLAGKNFYADAEMKSVLADVNPNLVISADCKPLSKMRMIKDTTELRLMRKAIAISIAGHIALIKGAKPGMKEYELEALMEYEFKAGGAEFEGYPSIIGSNYNACVLHYTSNRRTTLTNDLVLADCGAEYHGYTADITRTIPVTGTFSPEQRIIYNLVLEAQDSGIAACKPGAEFKAPHKAALKVIERGLLSLGIIDSAAQTKRYFMHGTSHYLGLDVHDVGDGGPLAPNTVITVEPGIYIAAGSSCDKKWWNIGVRIEDDILITTQGNENLSASLARTAKDIEALMGSK